MLELNKIYCMDCLEGLKQIEDKSIDLVLTDPPYFHGADIISASQKDKYDSSWDKKFDENIIKEIFRVSKNQIIFGAEHLSFMLPRSRGWYVWDKRINDKESNDFGDCEMIYTSFNKPARMIRYLWNGFRVQLKEKRYDHPTQKPLIIINKLIKENSKEGDIICDTFMGSGTTAVACKQLNRKFIGFEINPEYVKIANKRLAQEVLI